MAINPLASRILSPFGEDLREEDIRGVDEALKEALDKNIKVSDQLKLLLKERTNVR